MREARTCHTIALRSDTPTGNIFTTTLLPLDPSTTTTSHSYLALTSDDTITLLSGDTQPWTLQPNHKTTRALLPKGTSQLLTAGDDSSIKLWDPRSSLTTPSLNVPCPAPVLSLASPDTSSSILAAGCELADREAVLGFWDLRSSTSPVQRYKEVHSDDIVSLTYHPSHAWCLVSGSADGLVNLYDTRQVDEDEVLVRVWNLGSGLARARFLDGGEVVAGLSCDEKLALWRVEAGDDGGGGEGDEGEWVFGDTRPLVGCDYVVDLLPAHAGMTGGGVLAAGHFEQERLDLIPLRQTPAWDFLADESIRLGKGLGEELVRCVVLDDVNERIITGSEDRYVRVWSDFG